MLQHVPSSNVMPQDDDFDADDIAELDILNKTSPVDPFTDNIVSYIAGFIVRRLIPSVKCSICRSRLLSTSDPRHLFPCRYFDLINIKDRGGLVRPSKAVIKTCMNSERVIRQYSKREMASSKLAARIRLTVIENGVAFPDDHDSGLDSHATQLTKSIIDAYLKVKLHHLSKLSSDLLTGKRLRSKLTKTILFRHQ